MSGPRACAARSQLLALRPDLEILELRGNVDTRLSKLAEGGYDGIVLASAGLARLGRLDEVSFRFELDEMTPAAGPGLPGARGARRRRPGRGRGGRGSPTATR